MVGLGVVDRNFLHVDIDAPGALDICHGLFYDRKGLEAEEVHLYKSGLFNHATFILGHDDFFFRFRCFIDSGAYGHPIGDIVTADDHTACMHASVADCPLKGFREFQRFYDQLVLGCQFGFEFRHIVIAVVECRFQFFSVDTGHSLGDEFGKSVALAQRQLLDTCHILDCRFCGHRSVCDDMSHFLFAVFLCDVAEHISSAIVVEVNIDIGEGDTVWVEESFEQQVVFHRVDLGDAQTVGHAATGGGSTSRAYADSELFACGVDEVLHDKEVAGETHRLHYMEFELYALAQFFREGIAIAFFCAFVGEFCKVVGLEFDAVEFVVTAEFLDLCFCIFLTENHVAVFVASEFVE